jgi:hypothetical protein
VRIVGNRESIGDYFYTGNSASKGKKVSENKTGNWNRLD